MKIANSILELIGNTSLIRLNRVGKESGIEILVKPEFLNPSGSIKDRIAKYMVEAAEREGKLKEGDTIIEATTGNTGTALSFVAAVKGYKMLAFAPEKTANQARAAIMKAYGCKIHTVNTDAYEQDHNEIDSSVHGGRIEILPRMLCREMEKENDHVWWARQFSNPNNTAAHREWTAKEILEQTDGQLDAFVASVGTGGTLLGVAQALKEHNSNIMVVGVEPISSKMLAGKSEDYPIIEGITDGIIPDIFKSGLVDRVYVVSDEDAINMAHQLAEQEGLFCGISSGANVLACIMFAKELGIGKRIVTILPDSRDRYLEVEKYTT